MKSSMDAGKVVNITPTSLSRTLGSPFVAQDALTIAQEHLEDLLLVEDEGAAVVSHENGWLLALALFLTTVADFLCSQHQGWLQYKQQVRVRAAVIGLLYRQVVNLSSGPPSASSPSVSSRRMAFA